MLPRLKPKPQSNILRVSRKSWPGHERFVRRHECSNMHCETHGDPHAQIEFAHISYGIPPEDSAGMGTKAHSAWGISLCHACHRRCHGMGHFTFFARIDLDPHKTAIEFCKQSPIPDIRAKVPEMEQWVRSR